MHPQIWDIYGRTLIMPMPGMLSNKPHKELVLQTSDKDRKRNNLSVNSFMHLLCISNSSRTAVN